MGAIVHLTMAHKRMFSKDITGSDAFRDMPTSSQNLYFHLGMEADDDGFLGNYKSIMRGVGATDDDLKILLTKRFLLMFDSGVIVVKHWLINNTIRKDRYIPTKYSVEKKALSTKENGAYTMLGLPSGNQMATQNSIGEESIGKKTPSPAKPVGVPFEDFWKIYPKKVEKKKAELKWNRLKSDQQKEIMLDIPKRVLTDQWRRGYIPHPTTYLNGERWNDELDPIKKTTAKQYG